VRVSRGGWSAAWVGSYAAIADLFVQVAQVGVRMFQIYGYPFLEEAFTVGEKPAAAGQGEAGEGQAA